jgi:Fur family ferric uptake transcriptional regulator
METSPKMRMTMQRKVILEELNKLKTHPTAGELCQIVREKLPRISLGTVYRNLEILSRQGIIQKLDVGGTEMRFDGTVDNHYHLRCLRCGKVDDIAMEPLGSLEMNVKGKTAYKVLGHRLEFLGVCPICQKATESDN